MSAELGHFGGASGDGTESRDFLLGLSLFLEPDVSRPPAPLNIPSLGKVVVRVSRFAYEVIPGDYHLDGHFADSEAVRDQSVNPEAVQPGTLYHRAGLFLFSPDNV